MRLLRFVAGLLLVVALVLPASSAWSAGGGGGGGDYGGSIGGGSSRSTRSPAAVANRHYQAGLRAKAKAWKLEEKAAKEDDAEDRAKLHAKAQKAYGAAIAKQRAAVKVFPKHYEAENELGYALRKTGKYDEAIAAYDRSLALKDTYYPAVEYRAEAYLATGQLDRVKNAYMVLFRTDRKLAAQLMQAMDEWVAKQAVSDQVTSFAEWVKERKSLAAVGDGLSLNNTRRW